MTKFYKLTILIMSLSLSCAALAATTATTMDITASVPGSCSVTSTGADFGSVNQNSTSSGTIDVNCSAGIGYNVALDAGLHYDPVALSRNMQGAGSDTIRYTITGASGSGLGSSQWGDQGFGNTYPANTATNSGIGTTQQIVFDVSVSAAATNTFTAGESYSDTVTITVHF